ncbi:MAG: MATE family efflux transporter [Acutalibacteraceae bacterium]
MKEKKLTLFNLAWPIFVETLLFMLLGFIDVFALSRFDDVASSAVSTANQVAGICTLVFGVLSGASAVLISQYLGAENRKKASEIAAVSIAVNFILGLVISVVLLFFHKPFLILLGANGDILDYASEYLQIVGGFMFGQALLSSMATVFRSHGYTRITMYVTVMVNIVNTALDLILVLGLFGMPVMGVMGVAIATTVSRVLGLIVLTIVFFKKVEKLSFLKYLKPMPWGTLKKLLKVGIPASFETFNYNISQLVVTALALYFLTENEYIARNYVQNITMFFYIFSSSIGQASQILTGRRVGAGKFDEADKGVWKAYGVALILSMSICVLGILFRYPLLGIFTTNTEVLDIGSTIILINIILEFGRTTNLVLINSLRGAGDVYFPSMVSIFSVWILTVGLSYLLAVVFNMGILGMWIAIAADECCRGIFMMWRWKSGKWREKALVDTQPKAV